MKPKISILSLTTANSTCVEKHVEQSKCVVVLPQCFPMVHIQGSEILSARWIALCKEAVGGAEEEGPTLTPPRIMEYWL